MAAYDATGAKLWRAHFLGLLARGLEKAGRPGEALATVNEAIALVEQTSDNCSAAELHRIRGDVLVSQSKPKPALACFERALAIARRQHARSWEQRILASQATAT